MSIALPYKLLEKGFRGFKEHMSLTTTEWAALLWLAAKADAQGETDATIESLANELIFTQRSAQGVVKHLHDNGLLFPRKGRGDAIRLNLPRIVEILERK